MRSGAAVTARAVVAFGLFFALAGPAAAQQPVLRDPFDPVVTADQGGGGTTGEVTGELDPPATPGTATETEPLPTTGSEPRSWLAIAYILVALGAGALVSVRLLTFPPERILGRSEAR